MAKVRVFRFKVFDMSGKEDDALAGRYATTATVAILGGRIMPETGIYVDESELENGMTRPGFKPSSGA
jgi:hypothetical protein